jgi:hypothetical protein
MTSWPKSIAEMFEPDERQNFLDLLRPPRGYRLESAVGTTYSLDFIALTAALIAFVDAAELEDHSAAATVDSLHAITRLVDRVHIFVNRGQISGPSKVNRATIFYDRIVREVGLAEGSFHPKIWATFYRPRKTATMTGRPDIVRVICTSKNATAGTCWEAFVACEGEVQGKSNSPMNTGVRDFLTRLMESDPDPSPAIRRLRQAISKANFRFAKPLREQSAFLWQWQGRKSLSQYLPIKGRRALIVSPFVRKSFLEDILHRFQKVTVVSTQRELDAIADDAFMAQLRASENRVFVVVPFDSEDGGTAMELHAKILIFETEGGSETLIGSANASPSAWKGRNCEAIVKFAPGVSIDHFCDRFIFNEEPTKTGVGRPLRGWISEYRRQPYVEDEDERVERRLDGICAGIARLTFRAQYDSKERILRLLLDKVESDQAASFSDWSIAYDMHIGLLSQLHSDDLVQPFATLLEGQIVFKEVGVADLTEFLILRVKHRALGLERRRILKAVANFSQWQEQRDSELLQQLLTRERITAFLRAILFDATLRPPTLQSEKSGSAMAPLPASSLLEELSIEDVLRSCTEDPSRIEEINRVLKAFERTDLIDDGFRRFWSTFIASVAEAQQTSIHE